MINFYSDFVNCNGNATLDDVIEHIVYVRDKIGIDYVGLGSDFDGVEA
jgi:membrane dipeptidase